MHDLFGQALLDYQTNTAPEDLTTETSISEADDMPVAYLFRSHDQMPRLEQTALEMAKGKILDVGCGAGSHSLYLQHKGLTVKGIDISAKAIQCCELRGVENAKVQHLLALENETFDTILLLMNGTGIFGTLKDLPTYLQKLKSLLNPTGQILIDSSDLIYMYDENEDGSYAVPTTGYYGELTFTVSYKGQTDPPFPWLYLDYNTLQRAAQDNGLQCEMILEGNHFDYLARLY
jgi:SAM-dependent methyltransferase